MSGGTGVSSISKQARLRVSRVFAILDNTLQFSEHPTGKELQAAREALLENGRLDNSPRDERFAGRKASWWYLDRWAELNIKFEDSDKHRVLTYYGQKTKAASQK